MLPVVPAIPTFHAGEPDPTGFLFSTWRVQPSIAVGPIVMLAAYGCIAGPRERRKPEAERRTVSTRQRTAFVAGIVILFGALGSPLGDWADHDLLLAHMVQHLLLMLLAPALILIGTPGWMLEPLTRNRVTNAVGYWPTRPLVAYVVSAATLIAWHVPVLYEAALYNDRPHALEHASFFAAS